MGASNSRIDEDKALQLCRERKKFVQQALDGRCLLAAAHVSYVQSLRSTGTALRRFAETQVPVESSLYASTTSATPEQQALALTETPLSSYSPPPVSHSPPPPPSSTSFQVNHMKFRGFSSKKVEEKPPPVSVVTTVITTSSSSVIPQTRSMEKIESTPFEESSSTPPETPPRPWDYFGLSHPIDNQFSSPPPSSVKGETTEDGGSFSFQERPQEESKDSDDDDEFDDEPTSDTLVRSFENFNRVRRDHSPLPQVESDYFSDGEKSKTPELSPPVTPLAAAATPLNKTPPNHTENSRLPPPSRDFLSIMKEIETLFVKASETGKEVPRMLEANKLHFRPIPPSKQSGSGASSLFKTCLSCGEDPKDVPEEEAAPNTMKYLTWHRTESSRSSPSLNPLGGMNSDNVEELNSNLFENIGMIAGSHASTLDRLYAWERKLYDEVKGSQTVRREYDEKCKILRELESQGKGSKQIDKTRSVVKDLHSRIRVAIHRIDSISRRIEELRDNELQPQLEELIQGLSRMWEVMFECHKAQFQLISACHHRRGNNMKLNMQSELHREVTSHLEHELGALASSLTKWITGQRSYIKAVHEWLEKCVVLPQQPSKRKGRRAHQQLSLRNYGPPIYATCAIWLEKLEALPAKEVSTSIKALASDVARFLPRQEKKNRSNKNQNDDTLRDETLEDCGPGFDRFRTSLEGFAGQLNQFAESSVEMYQELKQRIQEAKINYEQLKKAYPQGS